jgi:hypothetical protein
MTNRDLDVNQPALPDESCARIREMLPAYLTAIVLDDRLAPCNCLVTAHLEHCAACCTDAVELHELMEAAYSGQVQPATTYPTPQLSFLSTATANEQERLWQIDDQGCVAIKFGRAVLDGLSQPLAAVPMHGQALYSYVQLPGSLPDLEVAITVFADDVQHGLSVVLIDIEVPSQQPPAQAEIVVVLRGDEDIWYGETAELGRVVFTAVPLTLLPQLRVEIMLRRTAT